MFKLPDLATVDYTIQFQNQDGALGTGLLITPKA